MRERFNCSKTGELDAFFAEEFALMKTIIVKEIRARKIDLPKDEVEVAWNEETERMAIGVENIIYK